MAENRQEGPFEQMGEAVGGAVGRAAGRANDVAMNVLGSLFGSAVQQMGEWWASPEAERAAGSFGEEQDRACRTHFQSGGRAAGAQDYDRVRPLYQFGYAAGRNPEYRSKPFDQVEAEVERAWESLGRERYGDWSEVRDRVRFGYEYPGPGSL